jgi:hypothetical protein
VNSSTGLVNITGAGSTTITATQAATGNYLSKSVTATFVVEAMSPTFGTFVIPNKTYGDASFDLTKPSTNSNGVWSFTSSNTAVATVNSSTGLVTVVSPGSTEITATQAAAGNYTAKSVTSTLTVIESGPTSPTFGTFVIAYKTYGDASFDVVKPSTNSSGVWSFTSSNTAVATVNSSTGLININGVGTTTITATQAAAGSYTAKSVTTTFVVDPASPTFSQFSDRFYSYNPVTTLNRCIDAPNSNSMGAWSFTSSRFPISSSGCFTISRGYRGSFHITATQAAAGNYLSKSVTATISVR